MRAESVAHRDRWMTLQALVFVESPKMAATVRRSWNAASRRRADDV